LDEEGIGWFRDFSMLSMMGFGWILAGFGSLTNSIQNQKVFNKCQLLTTSHRIYIIFYCFEVKSLDSWKNFYPNFIRIFDGFYLFTFLDTLFQLTTAHSSFQSNVLRPSILLSILPFLAQQSNE
jgi:hypothetical protein